MSVQHTRQNFANFVIVWKWKIFFSRVQSAKPTQLNVKYNLWRGRVHCTLAKDDDIIVEDITVTSLGKPRNRTIVFAGMSNGSVVKARVVKIKDQQITRYVGE